PDLHPFPTRRSSDLGGRGIIRGNPDLQPETNQSFELGAAYDPGPWSVSATLFHNDVRNLIETVRQPTCDVRGRICLEYENVAKRSEEHTSELQSREN